jgi:N-acetylglucosaminyl-diphospho-decaprenol L-rhamnosyltransferase
VPDEPLAARSTPRVSLVIVNYNAAQLTEALVSSVGTGADEVIVVDNASPQGAPSGLEQRRPGTIVIDAGANLGYGSGANLGAARATGDVIVVSNPDVSLSPSDLRRLAAAAIAPGVALVAPCFVDDHGDLVRSAHRSYPGLLVTMQELCSPFAAVMARRDPEWHATLLRSDEHAWSQDVEHVLGALMAIRASAFRAVGGFDERFFLYREETDLCARLRQAGWRVRHVAEITATHIGGASTDDPWPIAARSPALESHYRFIGLHWGPCRRLLARSVGLLASLSWALAGRDHRAGMRALRWHLGSRP